MDSSSQAVAVVQADAFAAVAAGWLAEVLIEALESKESVTLVLAGGGTPEPVYRLLAGREDIEWRRIVVLFGDERAVGPESPQSNYRMVEESLLRGLDDPPQEVLRVEGELGAQDAARRYERRIGSLIAERRGLDVAVLGLGTDGHTASLFPDDDRWRDATTWVASTRAPATPKERVSLTPRALARVGKLLFLATGAEKAGQVERCHRGRHESVRGSCVAAEIARLAPDHWVVDRPAASELERMSDDDG